MGTAPVVLVLGGMLLPIVLLLLALVCGVFTGLWALYQLWHDEWSVSLRNAVQSFVHIPRPHFIHHR